MNDLLPPAIERLRAAGIEEARFEAQLLLSLALGVTRTQLLAGIYSPPTTEQIEHFHTLLQERARRVPLAYLRGTQEFYGLTFTVTPATLIPRPETELLVDFAREKIGKDAGLFVDVGTGSGCIVTSVLANCLQAQGVAIDLSAEALSIARNNARLNGVSNRVRFVQSSLLEALGPERLTGIVSNPPYIPSAELPTLQPEVRDFEPRLALDGGGDGLDCVRQLTQHALRVLRPGGWLAIEIARGQAPEAAKLFRESGLVEVETRRDLAGIERIVCGETQRSETVSWT